MERDVTINVTEYISLDICRQNKAIPFDIPSLLTGQDKFDVIIHEYQKEFGYEALGE